MAWARRNAPIVFLGAALLASAVLLLILTNGLTFFQDTWEFLINRRSIDADALFRPHNEHIVVIPVAIELLLLRVFGMTSATPEYVLLTLALLATAALLFVYVRRRIGPWPALIAAVVLLFLGPAWQDILWPFELSFVGSVLFGLAMLLALDRRDRRGDLAACGFLAISIGFSSLGVAFVAGAAVDVFQRRRSRGLARTYVAVIPLLLYAAWWAGWGHDAERHLTLNNVLTSPRYTLEGLAAVVESLFGLTRFNPEGALPPDWGLPILVALVAFVIYGQLRKPGFSPSLWPVAASAAAYWFLGAFNYIPGREPYQSRYLYAGAVFVLLLAAELLRGVRFDRRALLVAAAVALAAVASNLVSLREGRNQLREQTALTRADLAAIEIAQRSIDPNFALTPEIAGTPSLIDVVAGPYLEAERENGSPAYTSVELATAPAVGRRQADIVLGQALPISTATSAGVEPRPRGDCTTVSGPGAPEVRLSPGVTRIEVEPGPHASFGLRRFATGGYPVKTEGAPGDSTTLLTIPRDRSRQPWYLLVDTTQTTHVCY
jgi:hypothetical protein